MIEYKILSAKLVFKFLSHLKNDFMGSCRTWSNDLAVTQQDMQISP